MSKQRVVYNGKDVSSKVPIKNGLRVRMVHSLAGEDLQIDEANIRMISDQAETFAAQAPVDVDYDSNNFGRFYAREQKNLNYRETSLTAYSGIWLLRLIVQPERKIWSETPLSDIIPELMGGVPYKLDADFAEETISGKIPAGTSYSQLFEILLVTGGSCHTEPNGDIRIGYPSSVNSSVIGGNKLVLGGSVEKRNPLTYLSVTAYSWTPGKEGANLKYLTGYSIAAGKSLTVRWASTYYDDMTVGLSSTNPVANWNETNTVVFTWVVQHDLNGGTYITITNNTTSNRNAYIFGRKVEIADKAEETVFSIGTPPTGIDTDNAKMITGHYLINPTNARNILNRLWAYYSKLETIKATIICDNERPGDVVTIMRPDTKEMVQATIKSAEYHFGALEHRADIEAIIGYVPESSEFVWTKSKLLTSSGTLTVSELSAIAGYEVTRFKAIVVGRGGDGKNGMDGSLPYVEPKHQSTTGELVYFDGYVEKLYQVCATPLSGTITLNTSGGAGGAGGAAGLSGKINSAIMIAAQQSDTYSYTVGKTASKPNSVFDNLSSADGKRYDEGFEAAGYVFGGNGQNGIAGNDGGAYNGAGSTTTEKTATRSFKVARATGLQSQQIINGTITVKARNWGAGGKANNITPTGQPNISVRDYGDEIRENSFFVVRPTYDFVPGDSDIYSDIDITLRGGASAQNKPKPTQYGKGGDGGDGGGGAGGIGSITYSMSSKYIPPLYLRVNSVNASGGNNGLGGAGGAGGDGCILLLF